MQKTIALLLLASLSLTALPLAAKDGKYANCLVKNTYLGKTQLRYCLPGAFGDEQLDAQSPFSRLHVFAPGMPIFDLTIFSIDSPLSPQTLLEQAAAQLKGQLAQVQNSGARDVLIRRHLAGRELVGRRFSRLKDPGSGAQFSVQLYALKTGHRVISITLVEPDPMTKDAQRQVQALLDSLRLQDAEDRSSSSSQSASSSQPSSPPNKAQQR